MEKILNYIDGSWQVPVDDQWLPVVEPATGKTYAQLANSSDADVKTAIEAAAKAGPAWRGLSQQERSDYLYAIANEIEQALIPLAEAEAKDNGKPIHLAQSVDIPRAASNFRFFAGAALHHHEAAFSMGQQAMNYTLKQALGTVACISPWNLPLYLFTWKIAPALATGNCVISKPSEVTPMTAFLLSKIVHKIGLPKGVLNIIHGEGARLGNSLCTAPEIKAISFTGGTATGAKIASLAAPRFKKLSLELGGKNPNIIFDDAPYEEMLDTTIRSSFSNQGQICLCGSRILIESSIYEQFKKDFIARTAALTVGSPYHQQTQVGAIVSEQHLSKILSAIQVAQDEGGSILYGGKRIKVDEPYDEGFFMEPTIIENLSMDCVTNQEEIFGPVVTLTPFDSDKEAIALANQSNYGLSATIWTNNLKRAHRVAYEIEAGMVWINTWLLRDLRTPFGGVKQSGIGREGGVYALDFFTQPKNVCFTH